MIKYLCFLTVANLLRLLPREEYICSLFHTTDCEGKIHLSLFFQIGDIVEKGQVKCSINRRACMNNKIESRVGLSDPGLLTYLEPPPSPCHFFFVNSKMGAPRLAAPLGRLDTQA